MPLMETIISTIPPTLLPALVWLPALLCALCLFLLWLFRWRHDTLAAKYAQWQNEAQAIEAATHNALYRILPHRHVLRGQHIVGAEDTSAEKTDDEKAAYPSISVVVPAHDDAPQLEYLLPRLLEMSYNGKFEVIVADQIASEDNHDVVRRLESQHPNLRYTRVPVSSRQIERRKLAITLGIKAAHGEWVIVITPYTVPETGEWLQHFAQNLDPELNFVEAYYNYYDDGSLKARRAILERVRAFNLRLNAYEQGLVIGCSSANYALRKKWFVEQNGFADSLTLPFGEEAIFAYRHAVANHSMLLCSPDTKLTEYLPDDSEITNRRICLAETMHHIFKGGYKKSAVANADKTSEPHPTIMEKLLWRYVKWYRLRERLCPLLSYVFLLLSVCYVAWRIYSDISLQTYSVGLIAPDIAMFLLIVLSLSLPVVLLRRTLHAVNERKYGLYIVLYDLLQPWRSLSIGIRRRMRRNTFVRRNIE